MALATAVALAFFVVLLPRCDRATAVARAEQFVEAVRSHPLVVEGVGPLELTVSVGIAHSPSEGVTFRDLFSAADMRLYHAKRDGRDRVGVDVQELPLPFG